TVGGGRRLCMEAAVILTQIADVEGGEVGTVEEYRGRVGGSHARPSGATRAGDERVIGTHDGTGERHDAVITVGERQVVAGTWAADEDRSSVGGIEANVVGVVEISDDDFGPQDRPRTVSDETVVGCPRAGIA